MKLQNLKLIILTHKKKIYSEDIYSVTLPSIEGEICILKEHFNFISILKLGIITIKTINNESDNFIVDKGYIKVINNNIYILSNKIVNIHNINLPEVQNNQKEISKIINNIEKEKSKNNLYIKYLYSLNNFYKAQINYKLNYI